MPEIDAAYSLFTDATPQRRWALEAYIVSEESFGKIADRYDVDEGAIVAYEKIFFDVIDHLDTDYVPLMAIGLNSGVTNPSLDVIWRWFAYHGGPRVLDFLLSPNTDLIKPKQPEQVATFTEDYVRDELLRKAAVGALTLSSDARSAAKLIDIYLRMLANNRRTRESAPIMESIQPNVRAMWESLPPFVKERAEMLGSATTPGSNGPRP